MGWKGSRINSNHYSQPWLEDGQVCAASSFDGWKRARRKPSLSAVPTIEDAPQSSFKRLEPSCVCETRDSSGTRLPRQEAGLTTTARRLPYWPDVSEQTKSMGPRWPQGRTQARGQPSSGQRCREQVPDTSPWRSSCIRRWPPLLATMQVGALSKPRTGNGAPLDPTVRNLATPCPHSMQVRRPMGWHSIPHQQGGDLPFERASSVVSLLRERLICNARVSRIPDRKLLCTP